MSSQEENRESDQSPRFVITTPLNDESLLLETISLTGHSALDLLQLPNPT